MFDDYLSALVLWYARGLEGQYWESKLDCEAAVRRAFPDEGPQKNYARVFYTTFFKEEN